MKGRSVFSVSGHLIVDCMVKVLIKFLFVLNENLSHTVNMTNNVKVW